MTELTGRNGFMTAEEGAKFPVMILVISVAMMKLKEQ
jgi:hypothetical protein